MSTAEKPPVSAWPDHTQLPDSDGVPVENFLELPQSMILRDSILPILMALHPDGQFAIGTDSGIYWTYTDPPLMGCKAPDWFYVPGVPPRMVDGVKRRSYVLWKELVPPLIVLEYVSGDGSEERDTTPESGKFWVYERAIRARYYGIFEDELDSLEVFESVDGLFRPMTPNARGRYPIPELGVELGLWRGPFQNESGTWMRWFDAEGRMLLTGSERAERLAAQLRALGIEPEA